MPKLETNIHIEAPPDRMFAMITDLAGAERRIRAIKRIEVLTDGPVGQGTRWRETRTMFGRDATEEMEITEFRPGQSYTTEAENCGCLYRCTLAVEPEGSGTRLSMSFDATALTFMARIMSAVMLPLMRKSMTKLLEQDLADIKAAAEASG